MNDVKKIAKELCEKSPCHHKYHDTKDCIVEDEALLLINQNKSNNFEVKSNNSQCIDCIHSEICQFYNALGAKVICYPCGLYEAKSNEELFKQALVEGVNRRIDKTIEEEKQIEQIEEMAQDICGYCTAGGVCILDGKKCDLKCSHRDIAEKFYNAGYRKQSVGEWISNRQTDELICSLCGAIAPVDCQKERFYKSNYCPECGAKMKGGGE